MGKLDSAGQLDVTEMLVQTGLQPLVRRTKGRGVIAKLGINFPDEIGGERREQRRLVLWIGFEPRRHQLELNDRQNVFVLGQHGSIVLETELRFEIH